MPNGKTLAECTFEEVGKIGADLGRIGTEGPRNLEDARLLLYFTATMKPHIDRATKEPKKRKQEKPKNVSPKPRSLTRRAVTS
jgi:hypothetical protein